MGPPPTRRSGHGSRRGRSHGGGYGRAAALVRLAVAVVVEAVAADLGGPRPDAGVPVVAIVAPGDPVPVLVGHLAFAVLAGQEARHERGAVGHYLAHEG